MWNRISYLKDRVIGSGEEDNTHTHTNYNSEGLFSSGDANEDEGASSGLCWG